jgi:lysophospholipase L1-like esterase
MVGTPPCVDVNQEQRNQIIENLSDRLAIICGELEIPYLNIFANLVESPIWLTEAQAKDGAHLRAAGYSELGILVKLLSVKVTLEYQH